MKKTKTIAICAMLSAISTAVLYIASISPTGQLGIVAVACLLGIAAVIETKFGGGIAVYVVTSILGLLIIPNKAALLLYILFFGYYPVIKSIAEKQKSRVSEWIIKLLTANAALALIVFLFSELIFDFLGLNWGKLIIFLLFNICFILFDIGVSKAIGFYIAQISKKIKNI